MRITDVLLCEQDISACAWWWDSGPGSRSGWDEPGPHQGPWVRFLWKSLWTQRQNQLSFLFQPHHVWDRGGEVTNDKIYQPSIQASRPISFHLLLPSFRWWFQLTQRRWVNFRHSVSLSVSALWISACRWPTSFCPANRPSRVSTTGTSTETLEALTFNQPLTAFFYIGLK